MDIDKCIRGRRSITRFKKKKVPLTKIHEILESFIFAPNAGNLQNWRLILVTKKEKLNVACFSQDPVTSADFLVVVCSDNADLERHYGKQSEKFSYQNTASGIQNMLLKAHSLGIGSCWIGSFDKDRIKKELKIPENIDVHAVIAFGYNDEKLNTPRRAPLRDVIFYEEYNQRRVDPLPLKK